MKNVNSISKDLMDTDAVLKWWFNNPLYKSYDLWFQRNATLRKQIDAEMRERFEKTLNSIEIKLQTIQYTDLYDIIAVIVVLDQFTRHIARSDKERIQKNTDLAVKQSLYIVLSEEYDLTGISGEQLAFVLMPLKHSDIHHHFPLIRKQIFHYIYVNSELDHNHLMRFYKDSLVKYAKIETQMCALVARKDPRNFDDEEIKSVCEKYYQQQDVYLEKLAKEAKKIFTQQTLQSLRKIHKIGVSLSGGVDSMVLVTLLKSLEDEFGYKVFALHINYGNRLEAKIEEEMTFRYCRNLEIPIFIRNIWEIHRKDIDSGKFKQPEIVDDRVFYEKITRDIRFGFYREFECPIVLGHNYDDVIENVWTNFSKGKELFNLQKMEFETEMDGVVLWRPFLMTEKSVIYDISNRYHVSYLLNTTPLGSNRGKMRNHFIPSTREQFGDAVDNSVLWMNNALREYGNYLHTTLFQPFYDNMEKVYISSHQNDGKKFCGYRVALRQEYYKLGDHFWCTVFGKIFHLFQVSIPSRKSVEKFIENLRNLSDHHLGFFGLRMELATYVMGNEYIYILNKQTIIETGLLENVNTFNQFKKQHFKIIKQWMSIDEK